MGDASSVKVTNSCGGAFDDTSRRLQVGEKGYSVFAGGSTADNMEASQVVGLFPSSEGLQIRGAFHKQFVVTEEPSKPDESVEWIPNNAQIRMHPQLRVRFIRNGSGETKVPARSAVTSREPNVTPAKPKATRDAVEESEKKSAKKDKKKEKKEKKEKKDKKEKKEKK